ncbi:MAG TPA: CheR family methyltransferase [Stellaceae bacterium]|nr:CheR family methyltransferase [Stellaceae bacterium]
MPKADATASAWTEPLLAAAAAAAESYLGLRSAPRQRDDLERALWALAAERLSGAAGDEALLGALRSADGLLSLARHLTVGESYFLRERGGLDLWCRRVLPALLESRSRDGDRRVRLWSAGCATGEEPYSLAMLLEDSMSDLGRWNVELLATDVNPAFLATAEQGRYRDWSFRGVPDPVRARWFRGEADGAWQIGERLRGSVRFSPLNLVDETWPAPFGAPGAMDLILCRNVLMYLAPSHAARVVRRLRENLTEDGCLLVGIAEASLPIFDGFTALRTDGLVVFRKATGRAAEPSRPVARAARPHGPAKPRRSPAADPLPHRAMPDQAPVGDPLRTVESAIEKDPTDAGLRYRHAGILIELGRRAEAAEALRGAIFLAPDMALAHFALGMLCRNAGDARSARRHFDNAAAMLERLRSDEVLADGGGLTVGELTAIVRASRDRAAVVS